MKSDVRMHKESRVRADERLMAEKSQRTETERVGKSEIRCESTWYGYLSMPSESGHI